MNAIQRFALGRPLVISDEEALKLPQVAARPTTEFVGRVFLSAIFLLSGAMKFVDLGGMISHAQSAGLPWPEVLVPTAAVAEILGGLSILAGFLTRIGALGLSVFVVLAALYFHDFWALTGAERQAQMVHFLKNMTIVGGLLLLIANGAGRYSVDRMLRKRLHEGRTA